MKTSITIITALIILVACNSSEPDDSTVKTTKPGVRKIAAVVTKRDSSKVLTAVLEIVRDKINYDSATGKKTIVTETVYGEWALVPFKTKEGKDTSAYDWVYKSKDSINTKIENRDLDSLLKN
jgi:hypothetical protein